ncbi:hypothetical protein [Accumulibacter sp.]|uniref:hypothetical protein n=1 Tax=Accumulibacter sp. TaxID=2053492 RepID=UPI00338FE364
MRPGCWQSQGTLAHRQTVRPGVVLHDVNRNDFRVSFMPYLVSAAARSAYLFQEASGIWAMACGGRGIQPSANGGSYRCLRSREHVGLVTTASQGERGQYGVHCRQARLALGMNSRVLSPGRCCLPGTLMDRHPLKAGDRSSAYRLVLLCT